ncbi:MAG: (2Fe-2S)-binding protein [Gemmataceae bacterium]
MAISLPTLNEAPTATMTLSVTTVLEVAVVVDVVDENCVGSCNGCESVGACADRVVCRCLGITETAIIAAIRLHAPQTVRELRSLTQAGGGCRACQRVLTQYLQTYLPCPASSPSPSNRC